ncbi:MAG: AMP-binding protein [Acidobacteriia bacterium]|nr:AMP-binding protein [Terriglobia bacterium]
MNAEELPRRGWGEGQTRSTVRDGDVIYSTLEPVGPRETVGSMLARNAAAMAERAVFSEKRGGRFVGVTWEDFLHDVVSLGQFLASCGIGRKDRVAVVSRNRGEMLVAEFASMCLGAVYVPIFPGYSAEQTRALIDQSGAVALLLSDRQQLDKVFVPPSVRLIVSFEPIARARVDEAIAGREAEYFTFKAALRRNGTGDQDDLRLKMFLWSAARLDPDAPCLLLYTSGTTGPQKGVLLSHDNILSQQRALSQLWRIGPQDRLLSYLPWHHGFGGIFEKYTALYQGATLALDDGVGEDFDLLLRNWKEIRPTVFFGTPKIYQQLVGHVRLHPEDEGRVFHEELRFLFTSATPLPANLSDFLASKRIPLIEGWGLTETSPCCTLTNVDEPRTVRGMVGYPLPGVRIRLAEDGEILVQGPNVTRGYHGDPEATAKVLPGDGWLRTGDLGGFAGDGLRLVGRKDRVFEMAGGGRIFPTEIENDLAGRNKYVRHVVVAGDGRSFLSALIFPDFFLIEEEFGKDREKAESVVKESLRRTVLEFNRERVVEHERLQAFAVVSKELSIEDNELTPSMKVRVRNVLRNAEEHLEAIYAPTEDSDCRLLQKVMRLAPDPRRCFVDSDKTLDQCHECGSFVFGDR